MENSLVYYVLDLFKSLFTNWFSFESAMIGILVLVGTVGIGFALIRLIVKLVGVI